MKEPAPLQAPEEDPWAGSRLGKIGENVKNTAHILVNEDGFHCEHCSRTEPPQVPVRAVDHAERLLGFVRWHRTCTKPEGAPPPQQKLPGTEDDDLFRKMYPQATSHDALRAALSWALDTDAFAKVAPHGVLQGWPIASVPFGEVAHWARLERAHQDVAARAQRREPSIPGLTIPGRFPMPKALCELLGIKPAKTAKKAGGKAR